MQKMKITISRDGEVNIEVIGGRGDSCLDFTSLLEKRLGVQKGERIRKNTRNEEAEAEHEHESSS